MHNKTILVTGSGGFIGKSLVRTLSQKGYTVRATVRSENSLNELTQFCMQLNLNNVTFYNTGDLSENTDWANILDQVDTIIHCAARAHILNETSSDPLQTFREINCNATVHLANEGQRHQVRRFIFLSSIGVLGNSSQNIPFTDSTLPNPQLPYAISKLEAEQKLMNLSKNMEIVIIRPPLVYGPGVRGNFNKLLSLVEKGIPLPFGKIINKRQFIGINNLVDFISQCITSPKAANQAFVVADKEVLSTTELIRSLSQLMKKKVILLPIPQLLLTWAFHALGKKKLADQLLNNLEINSSNAQNLMNWEPPYSLLEQLQDTVKHRQKN